MRDEVRDEIAEQVRAHSSLAESLTALPTRHPTPKKRKELTIPEGSSLVSTEDVGRALGNADGDLGIDYLELRFPFTKFVAEPEVPWTKGRNELDATRNGKWETWLPLNPEWKAAGVRMSVWIRGTSRWCTVGFNPSTILWGPGTANKATVAQTRALAETVYQTVVPNQVWTLEPFDRVKVTRLDVALDLPNVANPEALYNWYVRNPHHHGSKYKMYFKGGRCTGVDHSRRDHGGSRIYPKQRASTKGGTVLRFEAQARKDACELFVPNISYLDETAMGKVFRHYFSQVARGLPRADGCDLSLIVNDPRYRRTICHVVGEQVLTRAGLLSPDSRSSERRRELRKLGALDAVEQLIDEHWI